MKYAPNVSWLFPELPFAERPHVVAEAGFTSLEFGFPSHSDIPALKNAQEKHGFQVVLFNQDVPVWDEANRGYLADRERQDEFKKKLDEALEIVRELSVQKLMLPVGVALPDVEREAQRDNIIESLNYAAPLAQQAGVLLTIEALNPIDNPGYFLTSSAAGIALVEEIGHPHVKFQFDTYHLQLMEGNLSQTLLDHMPNIGHIQFADVPGRHEPGTGEINFSNLVKTAEQAGYAGTIGLEYIPQAQGLEALAWCMPEAANN